MGTGRVINHGANKLQKISAYYFHISKLHYVLCEVKI